MMKRISHRLAFVVFALILHSASGAIAQTGVNLSGVVRDSHSGEALPGANVVLVGTGMGSATDYSGRYAIRAVPVGEYRIKVSYVGYQTLEAKLGVSASAPAALTRDFKLLPVGVEGETIIVTAQAQGQNAAINQQLSSMPVMNVVSAAKIQELPDVNAAESVSRLPGVALIRTGGEGSQVIIRGLSPQYNQVTIDGVELPSDIPSSNNITGLDAFSGTVGKLGDRAEDLSMISSNMLGGIEVVKAITPDMDATLIGGVVNFSMRKASRGTPGTPRNESWVPQFEVRGEGAYNQLKNTRNDFRLVGSIENRFFDESFGVFLQGSVERRNLSDNNMGAGYYLDNKSPDLSGNPEVGGIGVGDDFRARRRKGATLVLDYQHEHGEIGMMNFISRSETRTTGRSIDLSSVKTGIVYFSASDNNNTIDVISNLFSVKHDFPWLHTEVKLSHSYSESSNPEDLSFNFHQVRAALYNPTGYLTAHPATVMAALQLSPAGSALDGMSTSGSASRERSLTGQFDAQTSFPIADGIATKIKAGGMIQRRSRDYEFNLASGSQYYAGGGGVVSAILNAYPWLGDLSAATFFDKSYQMGKFLNGEYPAPYPLNVDLMWMMLPIAKKTATLEGYRPNTLASQINNYGGYETKSAGYLMATLSLGDNITILPGVRYQNLTTHYTGYRGFQVSGGIQGKDTTVSVPHGRWLPMFHARYLPTEWLQVHFAYTNTLTYPDYGILTPRYLVATSGVINYNNYKIKPGESENLDLVVAFHSNEIGLLSFNGFRKNIKNLVFFSRRYVTDLKDYPDLPQAPGHLFELNTYINSPLPVSLYGLETEWQTNFWYLPGILSGLVLNVNYTHIFSEAKYPKTIVNAVYDDEGNMAMTVVDTFYTARMLNQPNDVFNLMIGYDYGGFSARVSMLYQDNIFRNPEFWPQLWTVSAKSTRWDLSVKQELPWFGLQMYVNINNLTGTDDVTNNARREFPTSIDRYGMSTTFGVRMRM
jgi:TonB-dependent receptor